jgi:hypothetical protein
MERVYHIYAKDRCLFHSVKEEEFITTWNTLNNMVGLMKTDYSVEDLSYEELTVSKETILNSSHHETVESISKRKKPFTVDYTGFGWVLIKKGVFENLEYPWFAPKMQVFESGAVQDMCGEDVSFCLDAIDKGYEIWCDPRIRVGHEKTRII